jgi:two-component system LytT family response regulator
MLKLFIVEDEKNVREALTNMVGLYSPHVDVVGWADSVSSAIKKIEELQPDIVLFDIQIKEGTSFDVLNKFPSPAFKVIFVTAFQQHAVQAFRFSALDYLLKPVDPDLLAATLAKAVDSLDREKMSLKIESFLFNVDHLAKGKKKIILKTSSNIHIVNLHDVVYCEADRSYTNFYLADKSRIMVSSTLGQYEEMFEGYGFLRIHASYLVNIEFIKRYERGEGGKVILAGDIQLPVAARKKEQLLQLLAQL